MNNQKMLFAVTGLLCLMSHIVGATIAVDPKTEFPQDPSNNQDTYIPPVYKRSAAVRDLNKRWTKNVVNYNFAAGFLPEIKARIKKAMQEIEHYTCVTFKEDSTAADRVVITRDTSKACSSEIGMKGGIQDMNLPVGCQGYRTILHELCRAVGMVPEHNRPDRDNYITIKWSNIKTQEKIMFQKRDWSFANNYSLPYDYDSIVHYRQYTFTKNPGLQTIIPKDKSALATIGYTRYLSLGDIRIINIMYSCVSAAKCKLKDSDCPTNGFVGKDCLCWCPGPKRSNPVQYCCYSDTLARGDLDFKHKCEDDGPLCKTYADDGACDCASKYYVTMFEHCPVTCNMCADFDE